MKKSVFGILLCLLVACSSKPPIRIGDRVVLVDPNEKSTKELNEKLKGYRTISLNVFFAVGDVGNRSFDSLMSLGLRAYEMRDSVEGWRWEIEESRFRDSRAFESIGHNTSAVILDINRIYVKVKILDKSSTPWKERVGWVYEFSIKKL